MDEGEVRLRYYGETVVLIPWKDAEGNHNFQQMRFKGEMDSKFMYSKIKQYIKKEFNKTVSKEWIKIKCQVINSNLKTKWDHKDWKPGTLSQKDQELVNKLNKETMELFPYEDKDSADSLAKIEAVAEAGQHVSPVSETDTGLLP